MVSKSVPDIRELVPAWNIIHQHAPDEPAEEDGMAPERIMAVMEGFMARQAIRSAAMEGR